MELQADLVAVSLTGSDALIHAVQVERRRRSVGALARVRGLGSARQAQRQRSVRRAEAHHREAAPRARHDPSYGEVSRRPRTNRTSIALQELARAAAAHVEHASGELRARAECQAPVHSARIDERSAWELFDGVPDLQKKRMTAHVFRAVQEAADVPLEQSLAKLDEQFGRAYYDRAYRGAYLGRRWRSTRDVAELYAPPLLKEHIAASSTRSIRRRCRRISRG